ncbi:2-hydroxychromene-2-carboxylate isomerase [Pseudoxanthomonas sp. JBR18]|uniref:2-hydroxychromene-2-carboxylate isomerase n=1 Tax=Pseudoxanthomonas sp. JBR18 TaxID=2969308 RepID=UPI0023057EA8|nr:2-hydroxychromene-2-carboxylate isomerase [Pseudoxanthomonas sp. JBR18]WCE02998.1 2-hydroxychromene-2-carboxylate isomerase [Pseudoxanthomonas sp. JBR18]
MAESIDYFVSLISPWSYLGHQALMDTARRHRATVKVRPVRIFDLFAEVGSLPLPQRPPVRQSYRLIELQRVRAQRGLPLNLQPKFYPVDVALADRSVIALVEQGHDPAGYMADAFAALWVNEQDLAEPDTLAALLAARGFDPQAVLQDAASGRIEGIYADNTQAAIKAGLPGLPGYVRFNEPFWGQDRIEMLDAALASERPPYRAG